MNFRSALITGATSGIGLALARKLASQGISLFLSGTRKERLESIRSELMQLVPVHIIEADLRCRESRKRIITFMREYNPDLVINNAGFGLYGEVINYAVQDQLDIVEVNCQALLEITLESIHNWKTTQKKGVILNVASAAAFQIIPGLSVYTAAKTMVLKVSQSLDIELEPLGIRVLTACPGMVKTEFSVRAGGKENSNRWGVMDTQKVVDEIWFQICEGQRVRIIDWRYRLLVYISRCLPQSWLAKILQKNIDNRVKNN